MTDAVAARLDDHHLAHDLAQRAGRLLLTIRAQGGGNVGARGDAESNALLLAALGRARPDDAVLSEESVDSPDRLGAERVWVIDPLDGTREFAEDGRTDWAVHVALVVGGVPVAGAVGLPAQGLVLSTAAVPARPDEVPAGRRPRLVVSRTRPPALTEVVREALGAELVPMGSAGAKVAAVITGQADIYAHAGGQYEWDSAAPVAVALAAGLRCSRLDGTPLVYNQRDPWLPDLLVTLPALAAAVVTAAAGATG